MKNIKFFTMAAAAAMLLGACSKENSSDVVTGDSDAAKMRVSFSIPANGAAVTRTVDGVSTAETIVNTAHVFVFKSNGVMATTGGYTELATTDFENPTLDATARTWKYTAKTSIETISGAVRIYVGINLKDVPATGFATEADLLAATDDVADLWAYTNTTTGSFAMFSEVVTPTLAVYEDDTDIATVEASVDRSVSKLVATGEAATVDADDAAWDSDINLVYTLKEYNVYNEAKTSYLVDGTIFADADTDNRNDNLFTFDESYAKQGSPAPATVPAGGGNIEFAGFDVLNDWQENEHANLAPFAGPEKSFYIGENKSTLLSVDPKGLSRVGNTTYAMVATQVTADHSAVWNAATKTFEWNGPAITANTDLALVQMAGKVYLMIVADKTAYDALRTTGPLAGETFTSYYFPDGYVHFLVWLNHLDPDTTPNKADVGRNEFIHLHVTGITTAVGTTPIFPGYPGDPTDPRKPIDPTENTNNPDPIKPEDPIDGAKSMIKVNISVNPWTYMDNSTELSR